MATQAQILANQANAQHSTGPASAAGKQRSSQNGRTHGLSTGYLIVDPSEEHLYEEFAFHLELSLLPEGAMEIATFQQIVDASWRLRKLHSLHAELATDHQMDPLVNPECVAQLKQLARYRAAIEMAFYRAMKLLGTLQTRRATRNLHLHEVEKAELPPNVTPEVYAKSAWSSDDREMFLQMHGRIGPNRIWDQGIDPFYQAFWVRRAGANQGIHQTEPNSPPG